jgi:hypothetical protein
MTLIQSASTRIVDSLIPDMILIALAGFQVSLQSQAARIGYEKETVSIRLVVAIHIQKCNCTLRDSSRLESWMGILQMFRKW